MTTLLFFPALLTGISGCSVGLSDRSLDECAQVAELTQIGNNLVTVCDIDLLKDTIVLPLSYFTEELHIVQLDSKDDNNLVAESLTVIGEQYILVSGSSSRGHPFKLFDKSGEFVADIGAIGNGPNEYQTIWDAQLDEKNNRIYLLPGASDKIFVYDLGGHNYDPIPLPFRFFTGGFHVDTKNELVSVFVPPVTLARFGDIPYHIWVQNLSGEVMHSLAPAFVSADMDQSQPMPVRISKGNNVNEQDIYFRTFKSRKDTLYHYGVNNNELTPRFTVNFGNRVIEAHAYFEFPYHYIGNVTERKEVEELPGSYIQADPRHFVVDKRSLKGAYFKLVNDLLGNIEIEWPGNNFKDSYYTANLDPLHFLDILENALANNDMSAEMRKQLTDLKNSIDENDNNYIIYSKLKQ